LVNCDNLIVGDEFFEHLAVDVVALQGLVWLASTEDVPAALEQPVNERNSRRVLQVSKSVPHWEVLRIHHVHLNEEVSVALVQGQEDHFLVLGDQVLDHLYGLSVDPQTLRNATHVFVKVPKGKSKSVWADTCRHFFKLLLCCINIIWNSMISTINVPLAALDVAWLAYGIDLLLGAIGATKSSQTFDICIEAIDTEDVFEVDSVSHANDIFGRIKRCSHVVEPVRVALLQKLSHLGFGRQHVFFEVEAS